LANAASERKGSRLSPAASMMSAIGPDGEKMLADAFQGFAVSFARYC
jgi:hypothetical protein